MKANLSPLLPTKYKYLKHSISRCYILEWITPPLPPLYSIQFIPQPLFSLCLFCIDVAISWSCPVCVNFRMGCLPAWEKGATPAGGKSEWIPCSGLEPASRTIQGIAPCLTHFYPTYTPHHRVEFAFSIYDVNLDVIADVGQFHSKISVGEPTCN